MKFLKNARSFKRWAAKINQGQPQAPLHPPEHFPCWAYLSVLSYGYEEDQANYLYLPEVQHMLKEFTK